MLNGVYVNAMKPLCQIMLTLFLARWSHITQKTRENQWSINIWLCCIA